MPSNLNFIWLDSFHLLSNSEWKDLVPIDNPFYDLRFLNALEKSGSISNDTAWRPQILICKRNSILIGALVCFEKWDSYGEYIFDFEWAQSYQRAGLAYYPKLTLAIPFTPTTGQRILVRQGEDKDFITKQMIQEVLPRLKSEEFSSFHILFHTLAEGRCLESLEFSQRLTHQYHWINRGYNNFDDYLQALKKDKRKSIRKERESLQNLNLTIELLEGDSIDPNLWIVYWNFYQNTHSKKWGQAYLKKEFFQEIFQTFRDRMVLVLVKNSESVPIAGTLNFRSENVVFGRYWGATEDIPNLHFECCYYKLIDYSIDQKIHKLEAGAQGEHKYMRGFEVVPIYSSHIFKNALANGAISNFLKKEKIQTELAIEEWNLKSPLKVFREQEKSL
jgi:predicted N-acyltransferase